MSLFLCCVSVTQLAWLSVQYLITFRLHSLILVENLHKCQSGFLTHTTETWLLMMRRCWTGYRKCHVIHLHLVKDCDWAHYFPFFLTTQTWGSKCVLYEKKIIYWIMYFEYTQRILLQITSDKKFNKTIKKILRRNNIYLLYTRDDIFVEKVCCSKGAFSRFLSLSEL